MITHDPLCLMHIATFDSFALTSDMKKCPQMHRSDQGEME